jgi:hypothetical protein
MRSGRGTRNWGLGVLGFAAFLAAAPVFAQAGAAPAGAAQPNAQTLDLTAVSLPVPAAGRLVAITNATIMTASNGTINNRSERTSPFRLARR